MRLIIIDIILIPKHHYSMRTTVTLDDDVYDEAMREAESRKISLGKAISDLARKGARVEVKLKRKRGLVLPELPEDSPVIEMASVRRLESEQ